MEVKIEPNNGPKGREDLRKGIVMNFVAGVGFGILAAFFFIQLGAAPISPVAFVVILPLCIGLISSLAGVGGHFIANLLERVGVTSNAKRQAISFLIIAAITILIVGTTVSFLGIEDFFPSLHRYAAWAGAAGLIFGAIIAITSYRADLIRQKMELLERQNQHLAELASREALLREAARNLTVAEERNRMARELHDSISQGVHGIVYSLRSLRGILQNDPRGMEILSHLEETADGTLKELRRLVMELTPSALEDHGLEEAVRLLCDLFSRRQRVKVELTLDYNGELSPDQEVAIYRITQEALTNIQKHAGASTVYVALTRDESGTTLNIKDNGKSFNPQTIKKGHGLANMTERARQSGGSIQIQAQPETGTTITLEYAK